MTRMHVGRTALVTGASRGIGAAVARALAEDGVRVAVAARGVTALEQVAAELGNDSIAVPCDITDANAVTAMVERVTERFGDAPDIIVNNAGVFHIASLATMQPELFVATMQTNLVAPFLVIRGFLPAMLARGSGHVVSIGSIADRSVLPQNGAYAPAKFAARALHEVLRAELQGSGVRATLISPSATDTPLWDELLASDQAANFPPREAMLPASAVANAVLYAVRQPAEVNVDELRLSHS